MAGLVATLGGCFGNRNEASTIYVNNRTDDDVEGELTVKNESQSKTLFSQTFSLKPHKTSEFTPDLPNSVPQVTVQTSDLSSSAAWKSNSNHPEALFININTESIQFQSASS